MNESQIVNTTLAQLSQNSKLSGYFQWFLPHNEGIDGELRFRNPADMPAFKTEIKREIRHYQIPQLREMAKLHQPFMVMAAKISPVVKEQLREQHINYVDTGGNIFIRHHQTVIWIDGNKTPSNNEGRSKAFTKAGLKIIFYLLLNKEAVHFTYRELAWAADVAIGNIKNIFNGLAEAGFLLPVTKKDYKLQNKRELLERWVTAYGETLRPSLLIETFDFWDPKKPDHWKELQFEPSQSMWSGEPGGDLLTNNLVPHSLLLYTTQKSKLMTKWTLIPTEKGILVMYHKFWKDEATDDQRHAPPLLVYADLLLTGDQRSIETAINIYKKYLQDEFGPY